MSREKNPTTVLWFMDDRANDNVPWELTFTVDPAPPTLARIRKKIKTNDVLIESVTGAPGRFRLAGTTPASTSEDVRQVFFNLCDEFHWLRKGFN